MSIESRNPSGFSLIEVLIGLSLLAIALLAIGGMQSTSIRGNAFSSGMMQASVFGQDGLEILKGLDIPNGVWPTQLSIGSHDFGPAPDQGGLIPRTTFTRTYTVTQHPNLVTLRTIRITVQWAEKNHTPSVSFSTIRTSIP